MSGVRHPTVSVALVGQDGNALAIVGRVRAALTAGGVDPVEVRAFTDEAWQAGSYGELLVTVCRWVEVDEPCEVCDDAGPVFACDGCGWLCRSCRLECGCAWCEVGS